MNIAFYEAFEEEAEALQRYMPPGQEAIYIENTIQEQGESGSPAPIISIRTQSEIPLSWAPDLSAILTRSTGYDHITNYKDETGLRIPCGYLPHYCSRAVAEHVFLMWLSLIRKLPQQIEHFHSFNRNRLTGSEMAGKQLLVVGVGNIGSEVVRIAQGMGIETWGVDLVQKHDFVNYLSLEEGLSRANIIVCAMNLTPQNRGYFNYETLGKVNPGTVFINIARGELSPGRDILRLLNEGVLAGVGLDVYQDEKNLAVSLRQGISSSDPEMQAILKLANYPGAITTPHNAFNTRESLERKAEQSVRQIQHFQDRNTFLWNVPD